MLTTECLTSKAWKLFSVTLWGAYRPGLQCCFVRLQVLIGRAGREKMWRVNLSWCDICVKSKLRFILTSLFGGQNANVCNKGRPWDHPTAQQSSNQLLRQWLQHLQSQKGTLSCGTAPKPQLITQPKCPKAYRYIRTGARISNKRMHSSFKSYTNMYKTNMDKSYKQLWLWTEFENRLSWLD